MKVCSDQLRLVTFVVVSNMTRQHDASCNPFTNWFYCQRSQTLLVLEVVKVVLAAT